MDVRTVVQTVVDETYGGLWGQPPLQIDEEDWSLAWVAVADSRIVGMTLTVEEWLSDLWVLRPFRGAGIGSGLLVKAEDEIAGRGYRHGRLRYVQSNMKTCEFYEKHGWVADGDMPHEHLPIRMAKMTKRLRSRDLS